MRLHKNRVFSTSVWTLAACAAFACKGSQSNAGAAAATGDSATASSAFKVALLTSGPVSDHSWNEGAYDGLMGIRDSLGAHVSNIQTKTPAEFEENFRQYGAQGYSLVFGHGFEFQDAAKRVGPDYPKTVYIVSSSEVEQAPNVAGMNFAFNDASYLAGVLAANLSKSGTIGGIGGTELPPVVASFKAFEAGAKSVNPKIKVVTSYIGNWDDVSAGREQALAQINRGVDVIFQNADAAGLGVFQAARETKKALVIGSNSNQNDVVPEVTPGSVVIDIPRAFLMVARQVQQKQFAPHVLQLGTESRVVTLVLNPKFGDKIPPALHTRLDSLQALVFAGKFHAPAVDSSKGK
jgi:basic membrane protein A and related proteins